MIAYSAIESGQTVFGNTGIKSLFDDAKDFLKAIETSATLKVAAKSIGQLIVQFAGQLAFGKIKDGDIQNITNGVLSLDNADSPSLLAVDLSNTLWKTGLKENKAVEIFGKDGLIFGYTMHETVNDAWEWVKLSISQFLGWSPKFENVNRFVFHLGHEPLDTTIPDPTILNGSVTGVVGTDGNDNITGSAADDLIIGGQGDDLLIGGGGKNLLLGGGGDDTFIAQENSKDYFDGGSGSDTADFRGLDHANLRIGTANSTSVSQVQITNVENVILTGHTDTVVVTNFDGISNANSQNGMTIDAYGQNAGESDLISFDNLGKGIVVNDGARISERLIARDSVDNLASIAIEAVASPFKSNIKAVNFETIIGTKHADIYGDHKTWRPKYS